MMQLVFLNIFLLGTGLIVLLFIRALPRIEDNPGEDNRSVLDRWLSSTLPEKMDMAVGLVVLRALRRAKVFTLKIDNNINKRLQKINRQNSHLNRSGKIVGGDADD